MPKRFTKKGANAENMDTTENKMVKRPVRANLILIGVEQFSGSLIVSQFHDKKTDLLPNLFWVYCLSGLTPAFSDKPHTCLSFCPKPPPSGARPLCVFIDPQDGSRRSSGY